MVFAANAGTRRLKEGKELKRRSFIIGRVLSFKKEQLQRVYIISSRPLLLYTL
jgi:hypothetical protein